MSGSSRRFVRPAVLIPTVSAAAIGAVVLLADAQAGASPPGQAAPAHAAHAHASPPSPASPSSSPSAAGAAMAEMTVAMDRMMAAMTVDSSGDVDRDFAEMMIPHHQGAIDMAEAELRHGRNELLRRIAQEIIVDQQQEIAAMRLALGKPVTAMAFGAGGAGGGAGSASGSGAPAAGAISHRDRVYAAEQFSNTVSVTDPVDHKLLGVIRLGDPAPGNLSPLYRGQLLVHGLGVSPDHRTLAVVSIGSNSVSFIDTATNAVKHVTYVGRSPHEAAFTPDGKELWVTVRGEDYISVIDTAKFDEKTRVKVVSGPGMTAFSPDGRYGYVCSSFNPEVDVITVADHKVAGKVAQASGFCPNLAVTPDGKQVWFTLKDVGKVSVFDARPPFAVLRTIDTGPVTNHVNIAVNARGSFAYVTIGGKNEVQVFRTDDFSKVATIAVGKLPHGLWPSGDGTRMYVGLENDDKLIAIDTLTNQIAGTVAIGQAPQAVIYAPDAVPSGDGTQGLVPLGAAGQATQLSLAARASGKPASGAPPTSVALFDQGLLQVLQAAVTGLSPKQPYVLALSYQPDGGGALEPLSAFTTNPAGAAIVNAVGPIRQIVQGDAKVPRRYLVIASGTPAQLGAPVQVQMP
jgi:YVTN family beta-propeller protein